MIRLGNPVCGSDIISSMTVDRWTSSLTNAKFKWLDSVLRKTVLCMQCGCRHLPWELVKDVLRKVDAGCSWAGEPARTFSHGYGMLEFDKDETLGWYMHWVK